MNYSLIKILKDKNKLSYESLSALIGKTKNGLMMAIKNETLSVKDLENIAKAVGVTPCVFFDNENENIASISSPNMVKQSENNERISELQASLKDNRERVIELKERLEEQKETIKDLKDFKRTYQDYITMYQAKLAQYEKPADGLSKASSE